MTDIARHLAALVGSRICHDLISPIGAIGNGVELIALDPRPRPDEVALLSDSVVAASARLRFFRIAFGIAGQDQTTSRLEVAALLGDLYRSGRISVDWSGPADLPRSEVKLAFLLLLCAEHAIPTGGTITIRQADTRWHITAASPRLRHDAALWSFLSPAEAAAPAVLRLEPAQVHFPLAGLALAHLDRTPTVTVGVTGLTVSF